MSAFCFDRIVNSYIQIEKIEKLEEQEDKPKVLLPASMRITEQKHESVSIGKVVDYDSSLSVLDNMMAQSDLYVLYENAGLIEADVKDKKVYFIKHNHVIAFFEK